MLVSQRVVLWVTVFFGHFVRFYDKMGENWSFSIGKQLRKPRIWLVTNSWFI